VGVGVAPRASAVKVAVAFLIGAAVAVGLGVYGRVHDPTGRAIFTLFFSGMLNLKVWFATAAFTCALFQLLTALRMYGKLRVPRVAPSWLGDAHRLSGTLAFLFSLPVAYHCLWALGFERHPDPLRRFVHSIAGCFFYGAFTAKVVIVRSRRLPGWALPVAGGAVLSALVVIWLTSALWFFRDVGFPRF